MSESIGTTPAHRHLFSLNTLHTATLSVANNLNLTTIAT